MNKITKYDQSKVALQKYFLDKIIKYKDKNNLSKRQIAEKLQIYPAYISQILKNTIDPSLNWLISKAIMLYDVDYYHKILKSLEEDDKKC